MSRRIALIVACLFVLSFISACGSKKAESSGAAIDAAKAIESVQEKADYLIGQAKAFYSSKQFDEAIKIAQYVLAYVDKNSGEAQILIEKARAELEAMARKKAEELKGKVSTLVK
jgi:hypothetical protein